MGLDPKTKSVRRDTHSDYLALVIDNVDPEGLRRVKFRLREIHRGIADDKLPWVKCDFSIGGVGGNSPGIGAQQLPAIGTKIRVRVSDDSNFNFQYVGPGYQDEDKTTDLDPTKPNQVGFVDPFGNKLVMDHAEGTFTYHHKSGTKLFIAANGELNIISANKIIMSAQGDLDLRGDNIILNGASDVKVRAGGSLKLHGGDGVDVRGVPINLNQSTSTDSPTARTSVDERQTPTKRDVKNMTDF